eukprot:TRINITY_DN5209_c0_g1_i2.p1 TRINITY_DN5209_c0_g1~~TRINITY_DN5209_c0_g1_i2.p1  ORF type:complete len:299 (+),score=66.18 TRINITY_DN5209_c0_g1_i2:283-1179(+)
MKVLDNDSTWMKGSNAMFILSNHSATVEIYPFFWTYNGVYQYERNVYSPQLKDYRDLVIYTPPSYYENPFKIIDNVLIMHDGQNLFNTSTAFLGNAWLCQNTIDELVQEGQMKEIVIIGVDNDSNRTNELTYSYDPSEKTGGDGKRYLDFIQETVIPYVQSKYRIKTQRINLGMLGSSLGGLISCYAGWTRSNIYSKVGCMSSSFWWNNEDFNNIVMMQSTPPQDTIFYLDSGNAGIDDDDVVQTQRVRDHFLKDGFQMGSNLFYYLDNGGQHNERYWGARFHVPMTDLYPPRAIPAN